MIKGGRTQAVIEDPWSGIMSTRRVWIAFIMMIAETPTRWNVMRHKVVWRGAGERNLLINCKIRGTAIVTLDWRAQP